MGVEGLGRTRRQWKLEWTEGSEARSCARERLQLSRLVSPYAARPRFNSCSSMHALAFGGRLFLQLGGIHHTVRISRFRTLARERACIWRIRSRDRSRINAALKSKSKKSSESDAHVAQMNSTKRHRGPKREAGRFGMRLVHCVGRVQRPFRCFLGAPCLLLRNRHGLLLRLECSPVRSVSGRDLHGVNERDRVARVVVLRVEIPRDGGCIDDAQLAHAGYGAAIRNPTGSWLHVVVLDALTIATGTLRQRQARRAGAAM